MKTEDLFSDNYMYEYNDGGFRYYCVANNKVRTDWVQSKNHAIDSWNKNKRYPINRVSKAYLEISKKLHKI
jgi:hypothetical protein